MIIFFYMDFMRMYIFCVRIFHVYADQVAWISNLYLANSISRNSRLVCFQPWVGYIPMCINLPQVPVNTSWGLLSQWIHWPCLWKDRILAAPPLAIASILLTPANSRNFRKFYSVVSSREWCLKKRKFPHIAFYQKLNIFFFLFFI